MPLLATALLSLFLGTGCGDPDSPTTDTTRPESVNATGSLRFTRSDGTHFLLRGAEVRCAPSSTEKKRPAIFVRTGEPSRNKPFFQLEGVLADLTGGAVIHMPSDYIESDPQGAVLYAYDAKTGNELDSTFEDSSGEIRFERAVCDPAPSIAFTVSGTLDSEFGNLDPVRVEGSFHTSG